MCREKIILNEQLKKHLLIIITLLISGCFLKLTAQQNSYFAGATLIGNYNKNFKTGISQPGVQLKFGKNIKITSGLFLEAGLFLQTSSLTYNKGLQVSESSVATLADGLSYLNTSNYGLVIGISQKIGNDEVYIGILPSYNSSIFNTYLDDNTRTQIKNEKFELALIELQWRQSIRKSDNLFLIAGFQYNIGKKDLIDSGLGKNIIFQIGAVLNFPL